MKINLNKNVNLDYTIFTSHKRTDAYCSNVIMSANSLFPLVPKEVKDKDNNIDINFEEIRKLDSIHAKKTYAYVCNILQTATDTAKSIIMNIPIVSLMYINDSKLSDILSREWTWRNVSQILKDVCDQMLTRRHEDNIKSSTLSYSFDFPVSDGNTIYKNTIHVDERHVYVYQRKLFLLICNISKALSVIDEFDSLANKLILENKIR